jgi:transglutaminase-like putative cysteine protease
VDRADPTPRPGLTGISRTTGIATAPLRRRSFLKVAGLGALALAGARPVLASLGQPQPAAPDTPTQAALDPIDELASALDYDHDRIFRFVADEIWYEPYEGVLRGARGTLESRAGNSADKALLLAALLDASLVGYRFVIGTIDDDAADALWTSAQVEVPTAQDHAAAALTQAPIDATLGPTPAPTPTPAPAQPTGTLPPEDQALVDDLARDPLPIVATATTMLEDGIGLVRSALEARGVPIPAPRSGLPELERTQHVWLRVERGAEWFDLDPSLAGQPAGQALGAPLSSDLEALPDELRHRIETRVILERVAGTGLGQEVVVEHVGFADELAGRPMALLHLAPGDLQGLGITIAGALEGTEQYQPLFQVGDTTYVGLVGVRFPSGEGLGGELFGPVDHDGEATAEWLETTVVSPGDRSSVARRTLFDRVGSAARAAGTIDPQALPALDRVRETEDQPGVPAVLATAHFLAVATGATSSAVLEDVDPADESPWVLRIAPHAYHLSRDSANATAALARGSRLFHDAPNIVRSIVEVPSGVSDGTFTTTLDILSRSFAGVPVVGAPVDPAPGITAGVLSHVVERLALRAGDGTPTPIEVSVGAVMEVAAAQGIPVRAFVPGDDVSGLPIAPDALELLTGALNAGLVAIAPERPVKLGDAQHIGWYLFDPATGALTDQMDTGYGQTMSEYIQAARNIWLWHGHYVRLGICVALIIKELKTLLELTSGGSAWSLGVGLGLGAALGRIHHWACH